MRYLIRTDVRLMLGLLLIAFALAQPRAGAADKPIADAFEANRLLGRGINLGNALDAPSEGEWGLTLKAEYFGAIKAAGFDSVRIPVRWSTHTGEGPAYEIDPKYLERVDWAVDQALSKGLVAILNIHHDDDTHKEPLKHLPRLQATWRQVGLRYKDRSDRLFFELLNEPNGELTDLRWQQAFPDLLATVRGSNPTRTVIIGPGHWNNLEHLRALDLPGNDRRIIATFHYYSPFQFTHQGADWVAGAAAWKGTKWTGTDPEREALRLDFEKAAAWAKKHDRPLFLGEFGAFSGADIDSRATWTFAVAREAERLGISWSYWEFGSGFGAYDPATDTWRAPILKALIPPRASKMTTLGKPLVGLKAVVLGSTSGIGRAVALDLARAGADVIVHGRTSAEAAEEVAVQVRALGGRAAVLMADLADRAAGDALVDSAWNLWDGLDAWLHLAGADTLTGAGARLDFDAKLDRLWQVDVAATIRLCRQVGRLMVEQGQGSIVTMGWDQAETGMEGDSGELFAATKGAILAFTRSLALSLAPTVRVNALAPGWIKTAWGDTAPTRWQERVLRETPLDRWGTPEDVAAAARFLVDPAASFLTGQVIRVNGGAVR